MTQFTCCSFHQIHSFVLQCFPGDTLARVRANLLHILYQMGHEDHQFRMRFKGQYLRDAYTLEDYRIGDHCVLKMVPLAKKHESFTDVRAEKAKLGAGQSDEIKFALIKEVAMLKWREQMMAGFSVCTNNNRLCCGLFYLSIFYQKKVTVLGMSVCHIHAHYL